jgi:hypothetical protein
MASATGHLGITLDFVRTGAMRQGQQTTRLKPLMIRFLLVETDPALEIKSL